MNNILEGGINSPIKHLLNYHRGTNFVSQQKNCEIYLLKRNLFWDKVFMLLNSEKPTFFCNIARNMDVVTQLIIKH